jgi:hypothetical protein
MRFDWYQATIEASVTDVIGSVGKLGHELRPADSLARRYCYQQGWAVHHNERGIVATIFAGGNGDKPHALATSDEADEFASLVREQWPETHLVTRMDVAQDFYESGCYDRLRRVLKKVAKSHRLSFSSVADELDDTAGRTQYIGSPTSEYRGRLYEKGWEVVGKALKSIDAPWGNLPAGSIIGIPIKTGEMVNPADWNRLELQARPKGEVARRAAAIATPEQAWTFTKWSSELAKQALALDIERFYVRTRKFSKDEEAMNWMCEQYGGVLSRWKDDLGDWDCVGREIGRIVEAKRSSS